MLLRKLALALTCLLALVAPATLPGAAAAAESDGLSLTVTASHTRARIGTIVEYTAVVRNTGSETIPGVWVSINPPDALNARAVYCPTHDTGGTVVSCNVGDLAPGSIVEVDFFVEVGSRSPNGPVFFTASSTNGTQVQVQLPALKIIGRPKPA
jgi:uncharacterized repeat protein (TIGR01451 family)